MISYACFQAKVGKQRVIVCKMWQGSYDGEGHAHNRISYFVELEPSHDSLKVSSDADLRNLWEAASRSATQAATDDRAELHRRLGGGPT